MAETPSLLDASKKGLLRHRSGSPLGREDCLRPSHISSGLPEVAAADNIVQAPSRGPSNYEGGDGES